MRKKNEPASVCKEWYKPFENEWVRFCRRVLLHDWTTGKNIRWKTSSYEHLGPGYGPEDEILPELVTGENAGVIKPRVFKAMVDQKARTKRRAEVFTPTWVCNQMNDQVDEAFFGEKNMLGVIEGKIWTARENAELPDGKSCIDYVKQTVLEVTCGEAPFLVQLYDAASGEPVGLDHAGGLVDRKLRLLAQCYPNYEDWKKAAPLAYYSAYGYEWQGDNLLLARVNLLMDYLRFVQEVYGAQIDWHDLVTIVDAISHNIIQMDGLKGVVPGTDIECKVTDWKTGKIVKWSELGERS